MIHEGSGDGFDQLLHRIPPLHCDPEAGGASLLMTGDNEPRVPGNGAPGLPGNTQNFRKACDYAIFCSFRKLRTVSLGCAPTPSQYLIRSASSLISAGFFSGSYVPTASLTRPSRGRVLSMTTTR